MKKPSKQGENGSAANASTDNASTDNASTDNGSADNASTDNASNNEPAAAVEPVADAQPHSSSDSSDRATPQPASDQAADDNAANADSDLENPSDRASERPSTPPAIPPKFALPVAVAVTAAVFVCVRFAFAAEQAGTWSMLVSMLAVNVLFAAIAIAVLAREKALVAELRPRQGDLSVGAFVAALMYGAGLAGRQLFLGADSPRSWWVARIYLQLGDTANNRMLYVGAAVFVIAALEELTWRGLVMRSLRPAIGPARAWLFSSVLYGLAHASTLTLLAHPVAGYNPLLVAAAFGGGIVWGHLYNRTGRLVPGMFAHALFSWAIVDFPLWRL
ncbi:MAG: CPBP family intramembrane metalloprotease [Polyangiaceae bacterium]|nr:CPBP family intramembrane metalloprotease [Polyangiaceae bacterium]